MVKQCSYTFLIGCCVGVLSAYWFGKSNEDGKILTEKAQILATESDKSKSKADLLAQNNLSSIGRIALKDKELAELVSSQASLELILKKQEEAIQERDILINGLQEENKELRVSLEKMDKAYRVQLEATKAYQQAMYEAKLKYGLGGAVLGLAVGFIAK